MNNLKCRVRCHIKKKTTYEYIYKMYLLHRHTPKHMYNITANNLTLHDKVSPRLMKLLCLYSGFGRVGCNTTMVWV